MTVAPSWLGGLRFRLELEAHGQLHLPLAEQRAVGAGYGAKAVSATAKVQKRARSSRTRRATSNRIKRGANAGNLRPVEEVKGFCQNFDFRLLADAEATREPQVEVLDRRLLEEVAWRQCKARRAARSVGAAAGRATRETEIIGQARVARDVSSVTRAREGIVDR